MNLQPLKALNDTSPNGLIHCSLCKEQVLFTVAAKTGWVVDSEHEGFLRIFEPNVYYCLECRRCLANELDMVN